MARPTTYGDKFTCVECNRSEPEVKHSSHGLCRGCSRKKQYKEKKKPRQKWAKDYNECVNCDRTEIEHHADGLCKSCYSTKHRNDNKEHYLKVEQKRRDDPQHKEEQQKYHHDWYEENKEEYKAKTKQWAQDNKEKVRQYSKEWRERNPEKAKQLCQDWYERNKEHYQEQKRKHRQENKEQIRQYGRQRRARKAGAKGSHTYKEWEAKLEEFHHLCAYCSGQLNALSSKDITEDHIIPLTRGGSDYIENIVPACRSCNSKKHGMTGEEYFILLEQKEK